MKFSNCIKALVALVILCIAGCQKSQEDVPKPIASFSLDKSAAVLNEVVTFTNTSQNATIFEWNFGDGNTSTIKNPTHSYLATGSFTITLSATGEGGNASVSKTITISYPAPVASFTMDKTNANTGEVITFTNTSQFTTSYSWDFGDGSSSTSQNPTHSYSTVGTFTITLTATGDGGSNTASKSIEITKPPLIGKWNIIEGKYNGNAISNLTGYLSIVDAIHYEANFNNGTHSGYVDAKYTLTETTFKSNINGNSLVLNGISSEYTCCPYESSWYASISCSSTVFNQWGATAIAYGENKLEIVNSQLVLTSKDGKTIIKYIKE